MYAEEDGHYTVLRLTSQLVWLNAHAFDLCWSKQELKSIKRIKNIYFFFVPIFEMNEWTKVKDLRLVTGMLGFH